MQLTIILAEKKGSNIKICLQKKFILLLDLKYDKRRVFQYVRTSEIFSKVDLTHML